MTINALGFLWPAQRETTQEGQDRERIRGKRDILGAAIALARKVSSHDLRIMVWHKLATLEPMVDADKQALNSVAFGWPDQDLNAWSDLNKALRSPLLRAARGADQPFWVDKYGIWASLKNSYLEQIDLTDFDDLSPFRSAIVVPAHLPFGQIGAALLTDMDPATRKNPGKFARAAEALAPAISQFIADYVTVTRNDNYLPNDCTLTSREVECLSWIAHGKTDYEISIILGCSHAGVRYHITRACAKLGAVNRAQSVFRACQLGYVGLES